MFKFIIKFIILITLLPSLAGAQGLLFNANDNLISERTSYNVFAYDKPSFGNEFSVSFTISIIDPESFGYIFYIKDRNENTSYSLAYTTKTADFGELKLNLDGVKNLLTVPLEKKLIGSRKWFEIVISFNSVLNKVDLIVDGKKLTSNENEFNPKIVPEIYFGKHESVIDVPAMALKNLTIKNGNNRYSFKFNESEGNDVYDLVGNKYGNVKHPNWLIKESYNWKKRFYHSSNLVTAINFDETNERFIFQNSDSLKYYQFRNETVNSLTFNNELQVPMRLGTSFLDTSNNKYFVYELNDVKPGKSSIASLDLNNPLNWSSVSSLQLPQQRHHHNSFYDAKNQRLVIFGGFGNQRLTNEFNAYNIKSNTWELISFSGDTITPRYFSGITNLNNDEILLFGGMGNKTGDQSIGKTYLFDCFKINFKTKIIKNLWELKQENEKLVSSRNMILSKDSSAFYTLAYPEYKPSSTIKLIKYNISNGSFEVLGDSIPLISERIRTNANLYFNKETDELFCTVQEFELDGSNRSTIYSINSPPISKELINFYKTNNSTSNKLVFLYIAVGLVLLIVSIFFFIKIKRRNKLTLREQLKSIKKFSISNTDYQPIKNSLSLFGEFRVVDKFGKDISYLFSPKIKQLFLVILLNCHDEDATGVTSEEIYTVLWPEKSIQKAKNLKNVTINQLRKILEDIDGIEVVYNHGKFVINYNESFYYDYAVFLKKLEKLKEDALNDECLLELTKIIGAGLFLKNIDFEYFDKFKIDFEFEVLKIIPLQLKQFYKNKKYDRIFPLTKILFNIDALNEAAFYYKIHTFLKMRMTNKAKKYYNSYIVDYKKIMGDDFSLTFREVSKKIPKELK